ASAHQGRVLYYGVDDAALGSSSVPHAADARLCPLCGAPLAYSVAFYGHLGHYACAGCGFRRPTPHLRVVGPGNLRPTETDAGLQVGDTRFDLHLPLPGLYNVYNGLAAVAAAVALDVATPTALSALATSRGAFGRLERVPVGERAIAMALVK